MNASKLFFILRTWTLGAAIVSFGNLAIGQALSSSGDCSPNMALTTVKGNVIILCDRYQKELQPIERTLKLMQRDYRLGAAKFDSFVSVINDLIASSIRRAEADYSEDKETRSNLLQSMSQLETVIRENQAAIAEQPSRIAELSQMASSHKAAAITRFLSGQPMHFVSSPHHQTIALLEFDLTYLKSNAPTIRLSNVRFRINPDTSDFKEHIDDIRSGKSFAMHIHLEHTTKKLRTEEGKICCWRDLELKSALTGSNFISKPNEDASVSLPFQISFKDIYSDLLRVWIYMMPEGRTSGSGGSVSIVDAIEY